SVFFMHLVQVAEAGVCAVPAKADDARLAVAVLGHDALGLVLVGLFAFAVLAVVVGGAVQKQHDVGVLFDRTGIAQVGQLRAVVGAAGGLFGRTRKLRQRNDRHVELLGHDLQVPRDIADLLHTALGALGALHELQVVDDDQADGFALGVLVDLADLGLDL